MAPGSMNEIGFWRRRCLRIPPDSVGGWLHLALWEIWMGILMSIALVIGLRLVATSREHVITVSDFSRCYAAPPVALPCEQIVYRGGLLNAAFATLCGVMLIAVALWVIWELWNAVEPKPITDDFLKLLNDSFGRSWRNPLKWPWQRLLWAYGFTAIGVTLTAMVTATALSLIAGRPAKAPTIKVETSQTFRVGQ
jgi:hypothetical protein